MNESELNHRPSTLTSPHNKCHFHNFEANSVVLRDQYRKYNSEAEVKYEFRKDKLYNEIKLPLTTRSLTLRELDLFKQTTSQQTSFSNDQIFERIAKNMRNQHTPQVKGDKPNMDDLHFIEHVPPNEEDISMRQHIYNSDFKNMRSIQNISHHSNGIVDSNENVSIIPKNLFTNTPHVSVHHTGEQKIDSAHNQDNRNSVYGKLFTNEDSRLQLEEIKNQLAEIDEIDQFVKVLASCQESEVIHLPERVVRISSLIITKPLTIVGSPLSVIEVAGSITIDLSSYPKLNKKVSFRECKIVFESASLKTAKLQATTSRSAHQTEGSKNLGSKSTKTSSTHARVNIDVGVSEDKTLPLFILKCNSVLEMSDCEIKSLNHQLDQTTGSKPTDVAFLLKYPRTIQFQEEGPNLSLILENCNINNFSTGIESLLLSKITVENSYFADCHYYAINISNPYYLKIYKSTIQNPQKSGINIRFSKQIDRNLHRRIIIEGCNISDSKAYGISIFGENMIHHKCKINVHGNRILRSKKDGLGIKNLSMQEIRIANNAIWECQGNCIFLQNVIDCEESSLLEMKNNKLENSSLYGIAALDASLLSENDEITRNQKGGIIISGGETINDRNEYEFFKTRPLRCIFNNSIIKNNKDSGVILVGCLKGPVVLNSCEICENLNGFYARLKPIPMLENNVNEQGRGRVSHNPLAAQANSIGHLVLDKCNIFRNRESGMVLRSLSEKLFLKETIIQQNKVYGIEVASSEDKHNLVLEKSQVKQFIDGFIGGEWGLLYDEHEGICKTNAKCQIF